MADADDAEAFTGVHARIDRAMVARSKKWKKGAPMPVTEWRTITHRMGRDGGTEAHGQVGAYLVGLMRDPLGSAPPQHKLAHAAVAALTARGYISAAAADVPIAAPDLRVRTPLDFTVVLDGKLHIGEFKTSASRKSFFYVAGGRWIAPVAHALRDARALDPVYGAARGRMPGDEVYTDYTRALLQTVIGAWAYAQTTKTDFSSLRGMVLVSAGHVTTTVDIFVVQMRHYAGVVRALQRQFPGASHAVDVSSGTADGQARTRGGTAGKRR